MILYAGDPTKTSRWRYGIWLAVESFILFVIPAVMFTNCWYAKKMREAPPEPKLDLDLNATIQGDVTVDLWVELGKGNLELSIK